MTTQTRQRTTPRWALSFLAAIVAVLALIGLAATSSAATTPGAETRVRASTAVGDVLVEPPQPVSAGERLGEAADRVVVVVATGVAAKSVDELAEIGFRSDTSHIFRNATGHLAEDTAENRALIQSALDPANLRNTITLKDGATLQKYFRTLPDGTQAWAEVRNGEITNGGLNVIPR